MKRPEQTARAVATPTRSGDPDRFFPGHTPRSTDSVHTRHRPHVLSSCTARRRRSRNWCRRHYCRSIGRTMDGRSQQSWETQRERRPVRKMRATNDKPPVSFKSPQFVSLTQRRWNCLVPVKTTLRSPGSRNNSRVAQLPIACGWIGPGGVRRRYWAFLPKSCWPRSPASWAARFS